jgi:hypothetical protein
MKGLLTALRTQIIDQLTYLGAEKAVPIVISEDMLPMGVPFPCVALKDGGVENGYFINGNHKKLDVTFIVYAEINSPNGEAVMGKGTQKGVLDIIDDLKTALVFYDPTGYRQFSGGAIAETASRSMNFDDHFVQQKKITMRWFTQ